MDKQKDILNKLKTLNSMIEDFLDRMDMDEEEGAEEKDSKSKEKEDKED